MRGNHTTMFFVLWFFAVGVGTIVGISRGHGLAGFLLSLLLSWLGVVLLVVCFPKQPPHGPTMNAHITNSQAGYVAGLKDGE